MHFPRSLTRFTAYGTHAMNWEAYNLNPFENVGWPPFLAFLDLSQSSIPLEHLKLLPWTLVTLKARLGLERGKRLHVIDANLFSAQLTTLALNASLDESNLVIENQLPLTLTDLSITSTSSKYAGLSHKSFHQLAKLDRLRTLEICLQYHHETPTRKNNMLELPPNLASLSVAIWNPRWFPSIPRSVTSLIVSHALHGIHDALHLGLGVFYGLPPDLVTLTVNLRPVKRLIFLDEISASNFPLLPKLRHLCIHEVGEFDSRVLRALNSRLKTLRIALKSVDKDDASFFPPGISSLSCSSLAHMTMLWLSIGLSESISPAIPKRQGKGQTQRPGSQSELSRPTQHILPVLSEHINIVHDIHRKRSISIRSHPLAKRALKTCKMFLANLPSEVLAQIIDFKDISYHILDLWKCGNKPLNSKLASGVTYVHLETESALKWRMPLMLSELRNLRYLYVHSGHEVAVDYSMKVRKLSPTIESLHLVCWEALNGLSDCSPGPTPAKPIYTKKDYGRGETRFYDIAAYFPHLHTLELMESSYKHFPSFESLSDLAGLPSTITRLIIDSIELDATHPKLASFLPRSLRRLETTIWVEDDDNELKPFFNDWSHAPPHLEHISKIKLRSYVTTDGSWLPRSLTSVEIDNLNKLKFTPALAAALPPALGNFKVDQVDYAAFSRIDTKWYFELPRQLHTLQINNLRDANHAGDEDPQFWRRLADLPRSLTYLKIWGYEVMNWKSIIPMLDQVHGLFWPSMLSTLELSVGTPVQLYHLLPPTLTSFKSFLSFNYLDEGSADAYTLDANRLPQKLALLHIKGFWSRSFEIKNQMPLSLTDLRIENDSSLSYGISRESFDRIKNLTLLKRLEIDFEFPLEECDEVLPALPLPPNIEVLKLSVWEARWISSLPHSVTDLDIDLLEGVDSAVEDGLKFLLDLPPHLVNLELFYRIDASGVVFPANAFPLLPRLRVLRIPNVGKFPSSVLRVLPSTLKQVEIDVAQIQETDAPFLPPNVSELCFRHRLKTLGNKAIDFAEYWPVRAEDDARDLKGKKFWERREKLCPYAQHV